MGMYDTINGQQVKCFPWVSLYKEEISYHGGTLNYFKNGSKVPYKAPHYNYGKNFIILDFNRFPESGYENYDYVIHVIKNGKVKETALEKEANVDWAKNGMVVDYYGTELNIHSHQDILDYIKDQREYKEKLDMINSHWNELFKESMKYFSGIGLLEKDSEEYKMRYKKIKEVHKLMEKEKKRIKPELDALNKEYEHWVVDTSSTEDCLTLGEYISASNLPNGYTDGEKEKCESIVKKMLQADNTLYDRYVKWQGDDAFLTKYL